MSSTPSLDFVVFYVSDLQASAHYFSEKLGFGRDTSQDTPYFVFLKGGDKGPDFGLSQANEKTPPAGSAQVYFKTPDLARLREELSGRGAQVSKIMELPFGAVFNVATADKHLLTIMQ
jgi:predicted enzyme related to lactoylglutathione lyase